jgi:hypothetical protein
VDKDTTGQRAPRFAQHRPRVRGRCCEAPCSGTKPHQHAIHRVWAWRLRILQKIIYGK